MMPNLLVALGAGAASALLFASIASGSLLAILLFCLAPLPIVLAALGWSHWQGLAAALLAAAGIGLIISPTYFVIYLVGVGCPAWWLSYLALLARPARPPAEQALDWYPVGRLVVWGALLGVLQTAYVVLSIGTDLESYREALGQQLNIAVPWSPGTSWSTPEGRERMLNLLVIGIPTSGAMFATVVNLFNLWLGGRVVRLSGRLNRPWPDLGALALPRMAAVGLVLGWIGVIVLDGIASLLSASLGCAMAVAYAVHGFAVLHTVTRGAANRGLLLGGTYAVVLVLGWPVLGLTLLGLADAALDLRSRFGGRPPPPST
jgi:hypothetical protein